ncbi:MFS transporter [Halorussus amylolyticus]|uniref:MFS transporter n=1 Tax=Halorussus amylolyticus TaxID=1126242 RepID=UPI001EE3E04A|nr:MFS transporter [Halorussus amylolyticus]
MSKYYVYQATVSFGFFSPVFTLFLLDRGLDYTAISTLSVVYAVLTVVGEIPSGYVADRIGRRNSLLLGSGFMTVSILGFAVVESYAGLTVLYVLWTLSLVFRSGSGDAWLYDTLEAELNENRFAHVRGRGESVRQAVTVVAMLAGGVLFSIDPRYPFLASGVLNGAGVVVLLTLPKNRQYVEGGDNGEVGDGAENADAETFTVLEALPVLREQLTRPPLRWFVVYAALFFGVVEAVNTYVQPISTETLGVPVASMGLLYAAFTGVSAVASYYAGAVRGRFGVRGAVSVVPVVLGVSLLAPVVWSPLALPAFFVLRGSKSLLHPIVTQHVNDHVESVGRATVLSAVSMAYALVRVPLYLLGGAVADATAPLVAVGVLGAVFLAGIGAVRAFGSPVGRGATRGSDTHDRCRRA